MARDWSKALTRRLRGALVIAGAGASLAACASVSPEQAARPSRGRTTAVSPGSARHAPMTTAERLQGGRYKLGAPYEAGGVWYVPADQPTYDEIGVASWYGDEFDGKPTANGERFDMFAATAAHATLPMPAIVEVTNLENGKSIRVRLNDRGPFKAGRLIDLSRGAADQLGFLQKGTADVRVRYLGPARMDAELEPLYLAAERPVREAKLAPDAAPITVGPLRMAAAPRPSGPSWLPPPPAPPITTASPLAVTPRPVAPPAASPAAPRRYAGPVFASPFAAYQGFAVQAGAFSDRARAETAAKRLASAGATQVRPVDMPTGARLYRVTVGPWDARGDALAARAQVAQLGFADARVVEAF